MKARQTIAFSIGPILSACIGIMTLPLMTWIFTAEDLGRLSLLQTLVGFCVMLFSLDLHQAYVREYYESNNKLELLKSTISIPLFFCVLTLIGFYFVDLPVIEKILSADYKHFSTMLAVCIFCQLTIFILNHLLRMQQRGLAYSINLLTPKIILLCLLLIIFFSPTMEFFENILLLYTISNLSALIVCLWITRKDLLKSIYQKFNIKLTKVMLKFSTPLIAGGYAYWGLTSIDKLIVKEISGLSELGTYSIASSFASAAGILATIFANLWHPTIYKWIHDGIQIEKYLRVVESTLIIVCCVWSVSGIFAFVITYLIPNEYYDVQYIFIGCLAAPLLLTLSEITMAGIGISRKSSYATYAALTAFATNILLNLLLTNEMGASGAAIAYAASFFVFFVMRTEATCYLWLSIPRKKMYFFATLYLAASIIHITSKSSLSIILWVSLIIIVLISYRSSVMYLIKDFKQFIRS